MRKWFPIFFVLLMNFSGLLTPLLPDTVAGTTVGEKETIAAAYALLQQRGFEQGLSYDSAIHIPVHFRNGSEGAFVAIGFSGPARGYIMLYKIDHGALKLLDLRRDGVDWGTWSLVHGDDDRRSVVARVQLVLDSERGPEPIIKITGAVHAGTMADEDGYFELFRITEGRINSIFKGADANGFVGTPTGHQWDEHRYQYVDINSDGTHEIREVISVCDLRDGAKAAEKRCSDNAETIHQFNGSTFAAGQSRSLCFPPLC